ncbi:MAG: phasin family protein [Alphaproteobacteria bacterium]|nr:phasin family protein [Alphaproteobacteria bacterium]
MSKKRAKVKAKKISPSQIQVAKATASSPSNNATTTTKVIATKKATAKTKSSTSTSAAKKATSVAKKAAPAKKKASPKKKTTAKKPAVKKSTSKTSIENMQNIFDNWSWTDFNSSDFLADADNAKHYESIMDANKQFIKALEESSDHAFKGFNDIMKMSLDFTTSSWDKMFDLTKSIAKSDDPASVLEKHMKSIHKEMQSVIEHNSKIHNITMKSAKKMAAPIHSHIDSSIKSTLKNIPSMK